MSVRVCHQHRDELVECAGCHEQTSCPVCGCWRVLSGFCSAVVVDVTLAPGIIWDEEIPF